MNVIKRDGQQVEFDISKVRNAVAKANKEVAPVDRVDSLEMSILCEQVEEACRYLHRAVSVEEIQEMVLDALGELRKSRLARCYDRYKERQALKRRANSTDEQILSLIDCNNEEVKQENSNKNPTVVSVQRDYMAGEVSKDLCNRVLLPEEVVDAHQKGILHFHDSDYFAQRMHNCCLVDLKGMFEKWTVISETMIERPKSFATACNVATQVIAQIASCQYGGQTISLAHLAPFVDVSRKKYIKKVKKEMKSIGIELTKEQIATIAEERTRDEIKRGIQMIQYQVITLMTTNGQAPFITVNLYLNEAENEQEKADLALCIEEMLKQRIQGVKNEKGVWITPAFPKLIYVLQEDNIREGTPYWYLTELAAKCTAKRMVPDYVSEKVMKSLKIDKNGEGHCYPPMGCRSFLTPYVDKDGKPKYYGRFNQGVVTLNLPDIALSSNKDEEAFWRIFDERLELCHTALRARHDRLRDTLSTASPIHWQFGGLARLKKTDNINELLYGGYSTLSLGYAGLYETVKYMTGKSHTDEEAKPFALKIMQHMNDACAKWKEEENIDYSIYGTPLESTTYKFAKCLQRRFGVIEGITDRNYITNSYHVPVFEEIDAFTKLKFESEFQALSPGGAISYIEVPNLQQNIPAVLSVIQFIYDNIMYAELNTKSDYCQECGYDGEIQIVKDKEGKLIWRCPKCGNTNQDTMNVARRTCGYIGTQFWNQGRTQEIRDRVMHL